jgi:hypothetical protein
MLAEGGRDGTRARAQLLERERSILDAVTAEEAEDDVVRVSRRAIIQQFDERGDSGVARVVLQ